MNNANFSRFVFEHSPTSRIKPFLVTFSNFLWGSFYFSKKMCGIDGMHRKSKIYLNTIGKLVHIFYIALRYEHGHRYLSQFQKFVDNTNVLSDTLSRLIESSRGLNSNCYSSAKFHEVKFRLQYFAQTCWNSQRVLVYFVYVFDVTIFLLLFFGWLL